MIRGISEALEIAGGCCSPERLALGQSMLWDVDDVVDGPQQPAATSHPGAEL